MNLSKIKKMINKIETGIIFFYTIFFKTIAILFCLQNIFTCKLIDTK